MLDEPALVVLDSPYRELVNPVLDYIDGLQKQVPGCLVTVVIPEALIGNGLSDLLHGQAGSACCGRCAPNAA